MVFKAGYRRLPKELLDIIWSYDNRYKLDFNKCLVKLLQKINHVRCMDMINHEKNIYDIYTDIIISRKKCRYNQYRNNLKYGDTLQLFEYVLQRRKIYKNTELCIDNLQCYNLKKRN